MMFVPLAQARASAALPLDPLAVRATLHMRHTDPIQPISFHKAHAPGLGSRSIIGTSPINNKVVKRPDFFAQPAHKKRPCALAAVVLATGIDASLRASNLHSNTGRAANPVAGAIAPHLGSAHIPI